MSTKTLDFPGSGTPTRPSASRIALGLAVAVVVAVALDATIAAIAHGAGAARTFNPLQFPTYAVLTVIGTAAGAAGWSFVRSKAANPRRVLSRLVPIVLLISFVPDLLVGVSTTAGVSWGAVAALMAMHVVVATVLVTTLRRVLPV